MADAAVDLGSRYVKIAVRSNSGISFSLTDTADFYRTCVFRKDGRSYLDKQSLAIPDSAEIVATGYGRNMLRFENAKIISEIKAHFRGAKVQTDEESFVLTDIGGQDSKIIYVKDGYIEDFVMNDKCAASTGRFLENACSILRISLDELSGMTENPVKLTSTCAVFSESEIIGLLAEGVSTAEIGAGINESIAKRLYPLIRRFKADKYFASGGAAKNSAVLHFLGRLADVEIKVLEEPQFNGALGCLYY